MGWKAESFERYLLPIAAAAKWLEVGLTAASVLFLAVTKASRIVAVLEVRPLRVEVERALEPKALLDWLTMLAIEGIISAFAAAMLYQESSVHGST